MFGIYLNFLILFGNIFLSLSIDYEFEFIEEGIHQPCPDFPDNFVHKVGDFSQVHIEQNDEGSVRMNGFLISKISFDKELEVSVEAFKKERGTWLRTLFTVKRPDLCTFIFDKDDIMFDFVKDTPEDQMKCPLSANQTLTMSVSKAAIIEIPSQNAEGEYKFRMEIGDKNDLETFICTEIPAYLHKL